MDDHDETLLYISQQFKLPPEAVEQLRVWSGLVYESSGRAAPGQGAASNPTSPAAKHSPALSSKRSAVAGEEAEPKEEPLPIHLDQYKVLGLLGRGGMGVVYRVRDPNLRRDVALKVVHPRLRLTPTELERFVEEAQVTAQLQHPGITSVHELGRLPDGRVYFTMEEIRGRRLGDVISEVHGALATGGRAEAGSWTMGRLLSAFRQLCDTLAYVHSRDVIHRDLKPANILIGPFGEVLVIDWGLARLLDVEVFADAPLDRVSSSRKDSGEEVTQVGTVTGTLQYMPPEQA